MKLARNLTIIFIILALIGFVALNVDKRVKNQIAAKIGLQPKSWVGQYLSGYHAAANKDYKKASEFFSVSLNSKSNNEVLQTQAMSLLLVSGQFKEAIAIAKDLNSSNNGLAKITLIVDAVKRNDLETAEKLAIENKEESGAIINKVIEAWIKYGKGQTQEAKAILTELQKDEVFIPFTNYNYALISDLTGDKKKAEELYDSLLNLAQLPNSIVSSAYDFYASINRTEKLEILKEKYNYDGKIKKHPKVTNVQEGVAESLLGVGGIIMTQYSPDKSASLFRLALYLNPKLDDAKLLLGSILMNEGDYASANNILTEIKKDSYLGDYAKLAIAKNFEAMNQNAKAKEYFENLTEGKDTAVDALVSLGDLSRKDDKYEEAANYYTRALEAAKKEGKDGKLENKYWAIYFARGVCYERLKQMEKSEADLQMALKLQPNQPDVMNYLGYTWIDMGKNLDIAKQMVIKAHEQKPDDPQITDSVGWALFKLGDYDTAVTYLEDAITSLPYDPVVNDHLGDAYWQTNRKNEARFQWQRALKNNPDAKLESELKKKLERDNVANLDETTSPSAQ